MKSITIKCSKRESVGKSATKALRNAGRVPCVIYGGDDPLHFSAPELDFSKLVYTPNAHTVIISFEDGSKINAILQDIQFHPVSDKILHIDFYELFDDKEVSINIPVRIKGVSPGVINSGGTLFINKRKFSNQIEEVCIECVESGSMTKDLAILIGPSSSCLLYTSPSPRDQRGSRMPSSA